MQTQPTRQPEVYQLLPNLQGLNPLKRLFWTELGYERVNQPLPRADWTPTERGSVAEDPILFASAGTDNDFHVIYVRLQGDRLRLTDERPIVSRLVKGHPYALFVFSNHQQDRWHFVNVKHDPQVEKRRLFRRITIGPEERLRTASERLALLDIDEINKSSRDLFGLSPLAVQQKHDEAFDVEAVTKKFFDDYKEIFSVLQNDLHGQTHDREWAHDYALQFLNRCMFLYFVQRKRWLGDDTEFLKVFWKSYQASGQPKDTFCEGWLKVLFLEAFNNKFHSGHRHFPKEMYDTLAMAPFLNGGLFSENDLDRKHSFTITDALFTKVFNFLELYNFTIAEDSPLDQEVAVDPEMIGKVYESLVNVSEVDEKGEAGIFYTPRTEIDLMCRLTVVDHLANHLGHVPKVKNLLYEAVFALEPDEKVSADKALASAGLWSKVSERLRGITVVDPACGSGSFLVGMLSVLDDLQERANKALSVTEHPYDRKKRIIGQALYGVDVMEWAVHVAELRLWLALTIDAEFTRKELHTRSEPLLPYFTFKVRRGDSLVQEIGRANLAHIRGSRSVAPATKARLTRLKTEKLKFYNNDPTRQYRTNAELRQEELSVFHMILDDCYADTQDDIASLQRRIAGGPQERQMRLDGTYETESPRQMQMQAIELQRQLQEAKAELQRIERGRSALKSAHDLPFVWDIAFVEIFEGDEKGFDIVIGNPPYVRTQSISDPNIAGSEATVENKKAYKAKLLRSVYQMFEQFFGYKVLTDTASHKLDAKSDLYIYFYFHGLHILNSRGSFCFITSNSWLDVGYGATLQEFLLRRCHVKLILDNQSKRSFVSADVNTVIVLLSAPDKADAFSNTTRFVMLKVPFEHVLSAVIFEELETAKKKITTPKYRVYPISQSALLVDGSEVGDDTQTSSETTSASADQSIQLRSMPYIGNKWGGKYLRAPEALFVLINKGKGRLLPLSAYASIKTYMILPKKADQVLVLPTADIPSDLQSFFSPFIRSPRYFEAPWVHNSPHAILTCSARDVANHQYLRAFVTEAERTLARDYSAPPASKDWFVVHQEPAPILFQRRFGERHLVLFNPNGFLSYDLYRIAPLRYSVGDEDVRLAGMLMSTPFWLFKELFGRTNLGEGALKTEGTDLARMSLFNPASLPVDAIPTIHSLLDRPTLPPIEEVLQSDRRQIDAIIFDSLGLTCGEREGIYEAVIELINNRTKKANSLLRP